jgi:hypothetical protein
MLAAGCGGKERETYEEGVADDPARVARVRIDVGALREVEDRSDTQTRVIRLLANVHVQRVDGP